MISDREDIFVWLHLPGAVEPTLIGRATRFFGGTLPVGNFVYAKSYLENPKALPIDAVFLPLENRVFETSLLTGHFSALLDAGPDAWGRRILASKGSQLTEYGYLLQGNGGQTGALSFSASPDSKPSSRGSFLGADGGSLHWNSLVEAAAAVENGTPVPDHLRGLLDAGSSAGGARPKFNVEHDGRLWIAKLGAVKDVLDVPVLEAGTLSLARLCGIEAPDFRLEKIEGSPSKNALLIERFDRIRVEKGWARRRYVSARTIFFSNPELQRYTTTGSYLRIARELSRWTATGSKDKVQLYRRMVFNCLVSNTDDHELNHGLIADEGEFRLSPAFDIVPQIQTTQRRYQALHVGRISGATPSRENILSGAELFALTVEEASHVYGEIESCIRENWTSCLIENGADEALLEKISPCFPRS